jgi:DNA-binding CsgD family transcriptional regulator
VVADAIRLLALDAARMASSARPPGAILVGPDDRVLMTSPATERLLGSIDEAQVATALRSVAIATRANGSASALVTGDAGALVLEGSPAKGGDDGAVSIVVEEPRPAVLAPLIIDALGLTASQREVTELTLQGLTRTQIARALSVTDHTVGDHLSSIYAQAGVRSRAELCALVFDRFYRPRRDAGATPGAYGFFLDAADD